MNDMRKGAITLLDILGWKGIWQRDDQAIEKLLELFELGELKANGLQQKRFGKLEVEVKNISDTIAIVTYSDDSNLALEFHAIMNANLLAKSILLKIPLRGATSYGYLKTDGGNIMVGPAVDEVASWYEITEWIGVIQTPSALFSTDLKKFTQRKVLVNYGVQTKKIGKYNTYCVNWSLSWNKKFTADGEEQLINYFKDMGPMVPEVALKYINTLDYYKYLSTEVVQ